MKRPELKVCGVNDAAFALRAADGGVDYLGFVFEPSSPRAVSPADAAAIRRAVGPRVRCVGVFVRQGVEEILSVMRAAGLDVVQLHRQAADAEVRALKAAGFGVWRLDDGEGPDAGAADGLLVDGRDGARTGGTGRLGDWSRARALAARGVFTILAGGLSAENLAAAAATGVSVLDVNSSLEVAPGIKSLARLDAVISRLAPLPPRGAPRTNGGFLI